MKKKIVSVSAALVLTLSVSIPASASSPSDTNTIITDGGSASHEVSATYKTMAEAETVYKVDVQWGDMEFTYNSGLTTKTWDPASHKYIVNSDVEGTWTYNVGANEVTVTNHSNAALTASVTTSMIPGVNNIIIPIVTNGMMELEDASVNADTENAGTPTSKTASISLSGDGEVLKTLGNDNSSVIGNITVSIHTKAEEGT